MYQVLFRVVVSREMWSRVAHTPANRLLLRTIAAGRVAFLGRSVSTASLCNSKRATILRLKVYLQLFYTKFCPVSCPVLMNYEPVRF